MFGVNINCKLVPVAVNAYKIKEYTNYRNYYFIQKLRYGFFALDSTTLVNLVIVYNNKNENL